MDANFLGEVADIYKCIVCHLVLKDPVLLVDCGHRLCKLCHQSLSNYATEHNNPILCPHDRKEVDPERVVDDLGVGRTILSLQVHCSNKKEGCAWTGELCQLKDHADNHCRIITMKKFMEKIENRLDEKDREMKELLSDLSLKDAEMEKLKKDSEERFTAMDERLKGVEGQLHEKEEEIAYLRYELSGVRLGLSRSEHVSNVPSGDTGRKERKRKVASSGDDGKENVINQSLSLVSVEGDDGSGVISPGAHDIEDVKSLKMEMKELDKKIARVEFKNASLNNEVFRLKETKMNRDDEAGKSCSSDDIYGKQIKKLQETVMNVDNYVPNKRTVFVWKLKNYAHHEKLGEIVDSPDFYPRIRGQCCCLKIEWREDKSIGVFLSFRKGNHDPEEDLLMRVTFSATSSKGHTWKESLSPQEFKNHKDAFTIKPGETQSRGRGFRGCLEYPELTDFIIDDVLTVTCEMTSN